MAICIHRHFDRAVAQEFLYNLGVDPGPDHPRGKGVPEFVRRVLGNFRFCQGLFKPKVYRVGINPAAVGIAEHKILILVFFTYQCFFFILKFLTAFRRLN